MEASKKVMAMPLKGAWSDGPAIKKKWSFPNNVYISGCFQ